MSIGIYQGKNGEKYFPYADSIVPTAFLIGRFIPFRNYNTLDEKDKTSANKQLETIMGSTNWNSFVNSGKHLFIFPISPLTPELFSWFADSQVRHQLISVDTPTSSTITPAVIDTDVTKRIHPGNPHLYWRFLWSAKQNQNQNFASYQVVDYVPTYESLSPYLLLPFGDELHTQLVVFPNNVLSPPSPPLEERKISAELAETAETAETAYCGDVSQLWREAQARGTIGTFDSCGALYRRQTDLGRRLFDSSNGNTDGSNSNYDWLLAQSMPEEFSTEIDLQNQNSKHLGQEPSVASLLAAEIHNFEVAAQTLDQEEKKSSEFIKDTNSFWHSDADKRVKDLELEDTALNWQLENLKSQLATTRRLYSQRQRELYALQKLPFLKELKEK